MDGNQPPPEAIRVAMAGGSPIVQRGVRDVLERGGCAVHAVDGFPAGSDADGRHDVLLLIDRCDPAPAARTLVLIEDGREDQALAAIRAGALGVLQLGASPRDLLDAVYEVAGGGTACERSLLPLVFARLRAPDSTPSHDAVPELQLLTTREADVLHLLAQGLCNRDIAVRLAVSIGTVKTHLRHIFRKLNVAGRTQAVLLATGGRRESVAERGRAA